MLLGKGKALPSAWEGCEYWTQVYTGGRGLKFHFDKDESKVVSKGEFAFPILSCVIYLTDEHSSSPDVGAELKHKQGGERGGDSTASHIPKQSPTIVVDQVYGEDDEDAPHKSILSYPRRNRVLIFDGRLAHGVLDSINITTRKTLLINFWAEKPENLNRISEDDLKTFGLADEMTTSHLKHSTLEQKDNTDGGEGLPPSEKHMVKYAFKPQGEEEDEVVMLDDVSKSIPHKAFSEAFCVSVNHPEHVLYPIEAFEGMEPCTLGAFCREE